MTVPPFDPDQFSEPTDIDNRWFQLSPGNQFVYDGQSDRGDGLTPHRVIFTVTDATKVIAGVRTRVLWDQDIADGVLAEEEIHFHAQTDRGNVWSLGEYPEEHEDGVFVGAPSTWLAGVDGARPGIHIKLKAQKGSPPYVQGKALSVEFFNAAEVFKTRQRTCIPLSCFENVLVIHEFSPNEPGEGGVHKYYAAGVGLIRVEPAGSPELESLTLTSVARLDPEARAQANARVLELDARAYDVVPDVWGDSDPAELSEDDGEIDD